MSAAVFVDTSGLFAALDSADPNHATAASGLHRLLDGLADRSRTAVIHTGVAIELSALVQRRLGHAAARDLHESLLPLFDMRWIDAHLWGEAVERMGTSRRRRVSLVDQLSFAVMRRDSIDTAFEFDADFRAEGFTRWVGGRR